MDNRIVIDTSPVISLIVIKKVDLLPKIFSEVIIANAVWNELLKYRQLLLNHDKVAFKKLADFKVKSTNENYLRAFMDYGEAESVASFKEQNARYLIIDDKKARKIAESINVDCVGTLGVLLMAKEKGLVYQLRPLFKQFLEADRYFSNELLNALLLEAGENRM